MPAREAIEVARVQAGGYRRAAPKPRWVPGWPALPRAMSRPMRQWSLQLSVDRDLVILISDSLAISFIID